METLQQEGLFNYKHWRYLKASAVLGVLGAGAYAAEAFVGLKRFGGSWLGYALGITSAMLVVWLLWYAVVKRYSPRIADRRASRSAAQATRPDEANGAEEQSAIIERRKRAPTETLRFGGTLQGWLSAHIYFGLAVLVLATLHSDLSFGWNIHTLTYVLLLIAVLSGIYGIYVYANFPRLITLNMENDTLEDVLLKITELDEMARMRALDLPNEINELVLHAREYTRLGGSLLQLLIGSADFNCPTREATQRVLQLAPKYLAGNQPRLMRDLYTVLQRKVRLLRKARTDIKLKAQMQFWLYIHTPVSVALLGALAIHIFSVFFYW